MKGDKINKIKGKKIFITGGSSGIGYQAVKRFILDGNYVILPCRDNLTVELISNRLINELDLSAQTYHPFYLPVMDLSDLNSIKRMWNKLSKELDYIDVLILNAGLQYTGSKVPRLSAQGFELTFAVNHLAHQYLTHLILPLLEKGNSPRIVVTSSEVHNPNSSGGRIGKRAQLSNLQGITSENKFTMIDGSLDFSADKAYKDSKVCNILFAKGLELKLRSRGTLLPIIVWAPGLVIPRDSKGFFRYSRKYNQLGQFLFAFFARDIFKISESTEKAGEILQIISTESSYYKKGFKYYSNLNYSYGKRRFVESDISQEANNINLAKKLWNYSCKFLEIKDELL